jgi:hypothetical protein
MSAARPSSESGVRSASESHSISPCHSPVERLTSSDRAPGQTPEREPLCPAPQIRNSCMGSMNLSITHKFGSHLEADLDICEARHSAPDDYVAWGRITGAIEIATEAGELQQAGV